MSRFKVLKVVAVITTIILSFFLLLFIFRWRVFANLQLIWTLILVLLFLGLLISHSLTVLYLLNAFYPGKEVPNTLQIVFRIQIIGCWLCTIFLFLGIIGMFLNQSEYNFLMTPGGISIFILLIILTLCFVIQLVLCRNVIGTIQSNYRDSLLDNFL
ncbi:MAG: hypothetical protein H7122_16260 [Chitinophagaceae bacterium]|nr:hypothetical protein [Chitinophagaceae bacterium]